VITISRTASIAPGRTASTIGFAKEIAAYIKQNYGVELEVMMPIGGNPLRIGWVGRYKDLATWEQLTAKGLADSNYMQMVAKGADNFIPGSIHDSIWRNI
jgi:hypothetical protein